MPGAKEWGITSDGFFEMAAQPRSVAIFGEKANSEQVSALLFLLYKLTKWSTLENFCFAEQRAL